MNEQPMPTGDGQSVFTLVFADLMAREEKGIETYGTSLKTRNGRDAMQDLYEELLDAALYIRQVIAERHDTQLEANEQMRKAMDTLDSPGCLSPGTITINASLPPAPPGVDPVTYVPVYDYVGTEIKPGRVIGVNGQPPETILQEAQRLVHGDRGEAYGHPLDDMGRTAGMLSFLLSDKLATGKTLDARDVAMMMVCVKLSRERNKPKRDNRVDGCGYFETLQMIMEETERRGKV